MQPVKAKSVVYGIKSGREIQEGEDCDQPFIHIEKIILNIQKGTFSGMMFSVSQLKPGHKTKFVKVGLKLDGYYPFKDF